MKRDLPVRRGWHPATHGHMVKHGIVGTPEYAAWGAMIQRCNNPKHPRYPLYGGRGIQVCERWLNSFENFYADLGPRPDGYELDKIDNDKGYEPSNCRWVTKLESRRNRRPLYRITDAERQRRAECMRALQPKATKAAAQAAAERRKAA